MKYITAILTVSDEGVTVRLLDEEGIERGRIDRSWAAIASDRDTFSKLMQMEIGHDSTSMAVDTTSTNESGE